MKNIKNYLDTVLANMDCDLAVSYEKGIRRSFVNYVRRESRDVIEIDGKKTLVPETLITNEYIAKYYKKSDADFSAEDCFYIAVHRAGIPAEEELSKESAVIIIRNIIKSEYKDVAYIKRVNGTNNTYCVSWEYALKIASSKDVTEYIRKQVKKAEKRDTHVDEIAWRAYELEKDKIARLDALNMYHGGDSVPMALSSGVRMSLMVEAIFNALFTPFDFPKYVQYRSEIADLEDSWDYGERFQELHRILSTPCFNGEFYQLKSDNAFLDTLAERIALKILEKQ